MATVFKIESGSLKTNINWKPPTQNVCVLHSEMDAQTKYYAFDSMFLLDNWVFVLTIKYAIKLADDNCSALLNLFLLISVFKVPLHVCMCALNIPFLRCINWIFHKIWTLNAKIPMANGVRTGFVFAKHNVQMFVLAECI